MKRALVPIYTVILLSLCVSLSGCRGNTTDSPDTIVLTEHDPLPGYAFNAEYTYTLSTASGLEFVIEEWESGELVRSESIAELSNSDDASTGISISAVIRMGSQEKHGVLWTINDESLFVRQDEHALMGAFWAFLDEHPEEESAEMVLEDGKVLACIAFVYDSQTGLLTFDCTRIQENAKFLENYDYAQVLRCNYVNNNS